MFYINTKNHQRGGLVDTNKGPSLRPARTSDYRAGAARAAVVSPLRPAPSVARKTNNESRLGHTH